MVTLVVHGDKQECRSQGQKMERKPRVHGPGAAGRIQCRRESRTVLGSTHARMHARNGCAHARYADEAAAHVHVHVVDQLLFAACEYPLPCR